MYVDGYMRERGRQTDRDRDRQTERQTESMCALTTTGMDGWVNGKSTQMNKSESEWADRQTDSHARCLSERSAAKPRRCTQCSVRKLCVQPFPYTCINYIKYVEVWIDNVF